MNNELMQLYQQLIIDHGTRPRNFGEIQPCSHHHEGYNPLCGDKLILYLDIKDQIIQNAMFSGEGCAISMASASMMTGAIKGRHLDEVRTLFNQFHDLMMGEIEEAEALGKLSVLEGVKNYPSRIKCATLSWHALKNILDGNKEIAKTE